MSNADQPSSATDKPYARLEYLLEKITDRVLRNELERETGKIRMHKKFGLVFEEHLPEHVRLYHLPLQVGSTVVKRNGPGNEVFLVQSISKNKATITHEIDGHTEETDPDELVIIKKFGDPIYPSLIPIDRVVRAKNKPYHAVINAENFHALQLLLYCYEGQVDVIYIDPPYNTGARDWKYNNNYVDSHDNFRHSKWLSMMKKRLLLAKRLLRPNGVLICTIDDYENATLSILLDEIFPDKTRLPIVIRYNRSGTPRLGLYRVHEYVHVLTNTDLCHSSDETYVTTRNFRRNGNNSTRGARPTMFFPIMIDKKDLKIIDAGAPPSPNSHPKKQTEDNGKYYSVWPIDNDGLERCWCWSPLRVREKSDQLRVRLKNGKVDLYFQTENTPIAGNHTVWTGTEFDAATHGSSLVQEITGVRFPFPKSLYAVKRALELVIKNRPNALILDFFAGSGTTLHATCLLNAEDGGKRQCILVTNNEVAEKSASELIKKKIYPGDPHFEKQGICESVTWPRCKFAVNGKRDDKTILSGEYLNGRKLSEGFEENIEYFRLDYLDPNDIAYREKLSDILPILWLNARAKGCYESMKKNGDAWFMPKESPYAVLTKEAAFASFRKALRTRLDITHVFLVTDSEEAYHDMCGELPPKIKAKMLYKSYLENFRINIPLNV